jgi:polyhydroxyalkanoate synthesis regulator phasin
MTTKLQEVMEMGNQPAADRASYAITVQEALDAGTLTDLESARKLLDEMKDKVKLDEWEVPAEIQAKLTEAIDELIAEL